MGKYSDFFASVEQQASVPDTYLEITKPAAQDLSAKPANAPEAVPQERSILKDAAGLWGTGVGSLVQGAGWLFGSEELQQLGQDTAQYWERTLSDTQREANQKRFVNDDWSLGEGATDLNTIFGTVVQSLPHMMPGIGAAGLAGKGALALGLSRGAASAAAATAGSMGEGVTIGAMVGQEVDQAIKGMTEADKLQSPYYADLRKLYSEEEATQRLSDMAANPAALKAGAVGAALGVAFNKFLGDALTQRLSGGVIREGVKGGAIEGGTELLQSGFENYTRQDALNQYAAQPISYTDMVNEMVAGLAAGTAMGTGVGAAGGLSGQPETATPVAPPSTAERAAQARTEVLAQGGDQLTATNAATSEILKALAERPEAPAFDQAEDIGGLLDQAQQLQSGQPLTAAPLAPEQPPVNIASTATDMTPRTAPLSEQVGADPQGPVVVFQQDDITVTAPEQESGPFRAFDEGGREAFGKDAAEARRNLTRQIELNQPRQAILQNRDRSRPAYVEQMQAIANAPDYDRVSVSRDPNTGAPMVFPRQGTPDAEAPIVWDADKGNTDTVTMSDGKGGTRKVPVQYAVIEADAVTASNNADGSANEQYGKGGLTALNNGRTAGLQAAFQQGTAQPYVDALLADPAHGIAPEAIRAKKNPLLIRLFDESALEGIDDPGAASNVSANAELSAVEQAQTDARKLDNDLLGEIVSGDVTGPDNMAFVRRFSELLGKDGAGNALRDAKGLLTAQGQKRIKGALVERAYQDATITQELTEAVDNELKTLGDALAQAAGRWALMRERAREGAIPADMDITDALVSAVNMIRKSRQEGKALADLAGQIDAFAGPADQMAVELLHLFYHGKTFGRIRAKDTIARTLLDYVDAALAASPGPDMFGQTTTPQAVLEAQRGQTEGAEPEQAASGLQPDGSDDRDTGPQGEGPGRSTGGQADAEEGAGVESGAEPGPAEEVAPEPDFDLETQTEAQLAEQARAQQEAADTEARQNREAEQRAKADAEADDFVLSGSDSPVDQAEARGQDNLFDQPEPEPAAKPQRRRGKPELLDALDEAADRAKDLPVRVQPSDIPYQLAHDAYAGTSHTPDDRAIQVQIEYLQEMTALHEQMSKLANTDEKRDILADELRRYKENYLKHERSILQAKSRTISVLVTGAARFPTARNQKRLDTEHRRVEEFLSWRDKAQKAIRRALTPEAAPISSTDSDALTKLQKKLEGLEKAQERMKSGNKIVRNKKLSDAEKIQQLQDEIGLTEAQAKELLEPDFAGRTGFPSYALSNNNAEIRRVKRRIEELQARQETAEQVGGLVTAEFDGGTVELDYEAGYVRIMHDDKPSAEVRQQLKSNGFRWTPSETAWRRKLNNQAIYRAKQITGAEIAEQGVADDATLLYQQDGVPYYEVREDQLALDFDAEPDNEREAGNIQGERRGATVDIADLNSGQGLANLRALRKTRFTERQTVRYGVERVAGPQDAAHVLAPFRKDAQETMLVLVLDAEQRPLGIIRNAKGSRDAASVSPLDLVGDVTAIPGAHSIWLSHNHPSGSLEPSSADINLTDRLRPLLGAADIQLQGHVLLAYGSQTAAFGRTQNDRQQEQMATRAAPRKMALPVLERVLGSPAPDADTVIRNPQVALAQLKRFAGPEQSGVLLLDNRHKPVGFLDLTNYPLDNLKENGVARQILQALTRTNANAVITQSGDNRSHADGTNLGNLVKWLADRDGSLRTLDHIDVSDGIYESRADKGMMPDGRAWFSRDGEYRRATPAGSAAMARPEVEQAVDGLMTGWKGKPKVNVADTISEFPKSLRDAIRAAQAESDMRAVFWGDEVYILAPRIPNANALQEVVLHEVIGHYGLRKMLGADLKPLLQRVYMAMGNTAQANVLKRTYYPGGRFDPNNMNHRMTIAEELIAHLAESNQHQKLWNRIKSAIREGLRKLGFTLELNETDILNLLRGAQRTVEQGGISRPSQFDTYFRRAYHGTPHRFDKFSLEAIGTGEGAQAYGWGLYFAGNRQVAEYYREALGYVKATPKNDAAKQELRAATNYADGALWEVERMVQQGIAPARVPRELDDLAQRIESNPNGNLYYAEAYKTISRLLKSGDLTLERAGNLYEVEIPDDNELLDWDGRITDLPAQMQKKLAPAIERIRKDNPSLAKLADEGTMTGAMLYTGVQQATPGSRRATSQFFADLGIPGLRYLDGSSRRQGEGNHNYVIWDEDVVTVQAVNDEQAQAEAYFSREKSEEEPAPGERSGLQLPGDAQRAQVQSSSIAESDTPVNEGGDGVSSEVGISEPRFSRTGVEEAQSIYDRAYQSLGDKDKTVFERAKKLLKKELTPGGLLPDSVFKAKLERDFKLNGMEFDIANRLGHFDEAIKSAYGKPFDQLTEAETGKINEALAGSEALLELPEAVREELHKMRLVIKNLSREYAAHLAQEIERLQAEGNDAAAVAKAQLLDTIISNLDTYVHRSYRAFDDPNWPRKVPREVYDAAAQYLEQRYTEQAGADTDLADIQDRVSKTLELMLEEGTAFDSMEAFIKESKLGAKDLSVLQRRKQIAPEIRALLGEYTDPKVNFTKSVTKMSRLVMNQKFLDKVREIGLAEGFLFEEENRVLDATRRIAADASEAYAPLNGLYTFPEVEQAFRDALGKEQMADWFRTIVRLNGLVKYGKTVLSPTTAARNWMSASFFAMANGHFDFTQMSKSIRSVREYFTHGEGQDGYLRKLKELGVIYDTPYAGEMMDLLADSQLENDLFNKKPFANLRRMNEIAQKFYQYGDDFWKIMGFENEKALLMKHKGLTAEQAEVEAAERIRNTYPTYSMTGRFVQRLRRFPLAGTFVSFPAEIVRTTYHILRYAKSDLAQTPSLGYRKVAGLAIASGMIHALQTIAMAMVGMDDDEEEAFRDLAAPWQKNSNLLPLGRNEKGQIRLIDMSFLDPYNYWKRPINAMLRDQPLDDAIKSAAADAWAPFFGQDIAFGAISEILNNKKASGGRVFNPHAPIADQSADIVNHFRKAVQPGLASNLERIVKASSGEISASGRPYSLKDEAAALVGFRVTTFDAKASIYYKSFEFQDKKRDATSILSSVARNPNEVSDSAIRDAYWTAEETRTEAYEDMIQLVKAGVNSGLSLAEIAASLRNSGVSKADIMFLIRGRVPPWRPSDAMMRNAIKKAQVLFGDDVAKEFARRRLLIQQTFRESLTK